MKKFVLYLVIVIYICYSQVYIPGCGFIKEIRWNNTCLQSSINFIETNDKYVANISNLLFMDGTFYYIVPHKSNSIVRDILKSRVNRLTASEIDLQVVNISRSPIKFKLEGELTVKQVEEHQSSIVFHASNIYEFKNEQYFEGKSYVPSATIYFMLCKIMKFCNIDDASRNSTLLVSTQDQLKQLDYNSGINANCFSSNGIFHTRKSNHASRTLFLLRNVAIFSNKIFTKQNIAHEMLPNSITNSCQKQGFGYDPTAQSQKNKKYNIVICARVRNEAQFLLEWIAYHQLVGIDHFYLYDDNSTDKTMVVLEPLIKQSLVTIHNAQTIPLDIDLGKMVALVKHCSDNYAQMSKWILSIDIDEFVVLKDVKYQGNLQNWLSSHPNILSEVGSITIPRIPLGGNYDAIEYNKLITAEIVWQQMDYLYPFNYKSLSNTNGLDDISIHYSNGFKPVRNSNLDGGCQVTEEGELFECNVSGEVSIWHYVVKSFESCVNKQQQNYTQSEWRKDRGQSYCTEMVSGYKNFPEEWQKDLTLANPSMIQRICQNIKKLNKEWYEQNQICKDYLIPNM